MLCKLFAVLVVFVCAREVMAVFIYIRTPRAILEASVNADVRTVPIEQL